MNIEFVS